MTTFLIAFFAAMIFFVLGWIGRGWAAKMNGDCFEDAHTAYKPDSD